jgi:hypothetical protein
MVIKRIADDPLIDNFSFGSRMIGKCLVKMASDDMKERKSPGA